MHIIYSLDIVESVPNLWVT